MNRSNSFVSSLKWWPLQGNFNNNSNNNQTVNATTPTHKSCAFGSSVAVQKLRESKWFKPDEKRIFCAVVECGFIVEVRHIKQQQQQNNSIYVEGATDLKSPQLARRGNGIDDDNDDEDTFILPQDENQKPVSSSWFGVVLCKTAKDHKPKPETIEIYTVKIRENGSFKMVRLPLEEIWKNSWELRINNFSDKEKSPHNEKDIRSQVSFARKAKQSLWNNNKHFAYWCRYGSRQQDVRKRQMSECVKWGSVGMNAGMLLVMNKQK